MQPSFIETVKVRSKGQITLPKGVREILGVDIGDRVTFVISEGAVQIVNSAVYAMQTFQKEMDGEAEKAGLSTEDNVMNLVKEMRRDKKTPL